jgi:hypothetical protein
MIKYLLVFGNFTPCSVSDFPYVSDGRTASILRLSEFGTGEC